MASPKNTRALAAIAIQQVVRDKRSLADVLPGMLDAAPGGQAGLLHELVAGSLRWWWPLSACIDSLLAKPPRRKDFDVYCLMAAGLYQIGRTRIPDHAAVSETVAAANALGKPWSEKLVNAVLRRYLREQERASPTRPRSLEVQFSHPAWMIETIRRDWPDHWQALLQANNRPPSLTLRVNAGRTSRRRVMESLAGENIETIETPHSPCGLVCDPASRVRESGAWQQGEISVQDESAQLTGYIVDLEPGMRVLDACAAPGGKTCQMLELQPEIDLLALDADPVRLQRVEQNLDRLGLSCSLLEADAGRPDAWWDGRRFDMVLLDAPCSGSGVIRKHPDIKHLRRPADIAQAASAQRFLLDRLWPLLRPGGKLIYCTCSVFRQENDRLAMAFKEQNPDAMILPLAAQYGLDTGIGRQRLPGCGNPNGFFYACFEKKPG